MKARAMLCFCFIILISSKFLLSGNDSGGSLYIGHPDAAEKQIEYFVRKPVGDGPWPTVVFLHGHQEGIRPGAKDFVNWGVLDRFAQRGYLAVAVSQPGYGNSTGPADFCGPFTQRAVTRVIEKLRADGFLDANKIVIEGISRGALVAGLIAAHDSSIAGIVLISGLYDLPQFLAGAKTINALSVASSIITETGGAPESIKKRSLLSMVQNIKSAALILNGAKDDRTDSGQAQQLAAEITANGGHARAIIYPDYGHQIPVGVRDKEIDPFIDSVLAKK